jgi:hypothetical protein
LDCTAIEEKEEEEEDDDDYDDVYINLYIFG